MPGLPPSPSPFIPRLPFGPSPLHKRRRGATTHTLAADCEGAAVCLSEQTEMTSVRVVSKELKKNTT